MMTWKRIQTLLMGLVALLILSTLAFNMCFVLVPSEDDASVMVKYGIRFTDRLQFLLLSALTLLIDFMAIFGYSHRMVQIRLNIVNAIVLLCYQIWIVVEFFKLHQVYTFTIVSIFPLVAAILLAIAVPLIWKDEAKHIADKAFFTYNQKKTASSK